MLLHRKELVQGNCMNGCHLLKKKSIISIILRPVTFLTNLEIRLRKVQVLPEARQKLCLHHLFPSTKIHLKTTHMLELTSLINKNHQQQLQQQLIHLPKFNSKAISRLLKQKLSNQVFLQLESRLEVQLEDQQELQELDSVTKEVSIQLKQHT